MKADIANRERHNLKFANARLRYQFFVFITCMIASISFWLLIKLSNEYTLAFTIPVHFVGVPNTRILTGTSDTSIQVTIKAQGYKLLMLHYLNNPKPLDLSLSIPNLNKKTEVITKDIPLMPLLRKYSTTLNFANEIRSVHPELISVKLNRMYCKSVPVKMLLDVSFAPQYQQFEPSVVKPENVTVFGTRSMVDSVKIAQTEVIHMHGLKENGFRMVKLNSNFLINKPFFIPSLISVTVPVQKFTEKSVDVHIQLTNQVPGRTIKLFPDKTVVSCLVSMKDYQKLDARLFSVNAVLNPTDNLYHLEIVTSPEFVRNIKLTPDKVEYLVLR